MVTHRPNTSIRFETEVREVLDEYCKRTRLSLNAAVNALLSDALAEDFYRRERIRSNPLPAPDTARVCSTCSGGYYGASCPICD